VKVKLGSPLDAAEENRGEKELLSR
jgi:hypothetical protein